MKTKLLTLVGLFVAFIATAQTTLQEKLGYPKNAKLLIIHADDWGVSHSENAASMYAMEHGAISSGSIMVPCPWFPEIAAYANAHPKADLGLHLTLTSEWKYLKWKPVASSETVPHLTDANGFLFPGVDSVLIKGNKEEVEIELRAQIERARQFGIDFTHFDSHMGTLYAKDDYLKVLMKLGREYKVPVMLNNLILALNHENEMTAKDIVIDSIYIENTPDYKSGTDAFYTRILNTIKPGVHEIILHAAYDDSEMKAVTIDHPDYGAEWRQKDFNFFTSAKCKQLLQQNGIQVITWREIRDKIIRQ
ncbi:MAG: polysaccharide deacetylase family protein [Bacteroidota bacterium]|nr:polysaccharide deacetylase family protein [Bacteroidota bacterium]